MLDRAERDLHEPPALAACSHQVRMASVQRLRAVASILVVVYHVLIGLLTYRYLEQPLAAMAERFTRRLLWQSTAAAWPDIPVKLAPTHV